MEGQSTTKDGQRGGNEKDTMTHNNRDARNEKIGFWSSAHFSSSSPMKPKKLREKKFTRTVTTQREVEDATVSLF
jgi:hypothetical protein